MVMTPVIGPKIVMWTFGTGSHDTGNEKHEKIEQVYLAPNRIRVGRIREKQARQADYAIMMILMIRRLAMAIFLQ